MAGIRARDFLTACARLASCLNSLSEQQSRYPDISFGRTYVNLTIAPESGEEITEADHQLGAQIDSLLPAS